MITVRATRRMPSAGSHTVGAPDGGPGLPGTGWSREHGDLRVPHFLGLHAIQILPLLAGLLARRVASSVRRVRAVMTVGASYAALLGVLLTQALTGESVVAPSATTLAVLGAWLTATAAGLALVLAPGRNGPGAHAADARALR